MDDLSHILNKIPDGWFVGIVKFDHIIYADDLYCFCPSVVGLQDLMNVCVKYGVHHITVFNVNKCFDILFHTSLTKSCEPVLQLDVKTN